MVTDMGSAWVRRHAVGGDQRREAERPSGVCERDVWHQPWGPRVSHTGSRARCSNQQSQARLGVHVRQRTATEPTWRAWVTSRTRVRASSISFSLAMFDWLKHRIFL